MRSSTEDVAARTQPIHSSSFQPRIVTALLGLLLIGAPARALELPAAPPAHASDQLPDALPAVEAAADAIPVAGSDGPPLGTARLTSDLFRVGRIDWTDSVAAPDALLPGLPNGVMQPPAEKPPAPEHTGFKALVFETASDFNAFPRRTSTWVILAIGGGAAALAHPVDKKVTERMVASNATGKAFAAGKWIGSAYVQAGTAVGLYVVGRYMLPHAEGAPKTNKVSHLGFDLLRALAVSQALTQVIKVSVQRPRPTGECCAFPSGHASAAFATAAVLERHLGYRGAIPTFAIAAYVAASRLHDNRHYLSDVLFGGALGVASGWTVVGRHGRSNYAFAPVPLPGGFMVSISRKAPSQLAP
jgi:membrane-associated phospholipid phosphatase